MYECVDNRNPNPTHLRYLWEKNTIDEKLFTTNHVPNPGTQYQGEISTADPGRQESTLPYEYSAIGLNTTHLTGILYTNIN